ncbi:MAG TPA: antitoxin Xre/MbcA/ParS toxin-binding domain-containing protein [Sphingobacteriaceae bacterium]
MIKKSGRKRDTCSEFHGGADREDSMAAEIISAYRPSFRTSRAKLEVIREGIRSQALVDFMRIAGITQAALARILSVSEPTIRKYIRDGRPLDSRLSDHLLQLFELHDQGIDTFGSLKEFRNWLRCCQLVLGARPIDLLDTCTGMGLVRNELLRIDHGMLA